ncbi:Wyosine [tRNA(Phe)-imidazoG37] synthetase, radical SAM superfamily [Desulfonauticus submarinus]|uniref:Wyosine [tRNA(Phe)-imidazoG37] synthetase, radical SAM superfamily n=1 Tax=Desulfonauticus submarinus TaxID=206665 RepID=A0A1H0B8T3_9BACT|nr:radical SAM protein [Desulfonauticus submarinus]SDN41992.1 Wyosine [tRNA(Phe)-imidazoG37] synthetase, radical SAM superfamily [Desulfonauticus submarinus]
MKFKYIFGPVKSSRLGRSLGIDLLGEKICSFDCLYCEVGRTKNKTLARDVYVDPDLILNELEKWFKLLPIKPEVITFGGSGEPCLNITMGFLAREIKKRYDYPLAILTNSSLLENEVVLRELSLFDIILPSFDSAIEEEFVKINRPVKEIGVKNIEGGLLNLKQMFKGKIFLEILLLPNINASERNKQKLYEFVRKLQPDRVDITTLTRPGTYVKNPLNKLELEAWRQKFANFSFTRQRSTNTNEDNISSRYIKDISFLILNSLKRRPQTIKDISVALSIQEDEVKKEIEKLILKQKVKLIKDFETSEQYYKIIL